MGGGGYSDSMGNYAGSVSVDGGASPDERGSWKVLGKRLVMSYDDYSTATYDGYEVASDSLFFPNEESQRLWKRY